MGIIEGYVGCGDVGFWGCCSLRIRDLFKNERGKGRGRDVLCERSAIEEVDGEMDEVEGDFGMGRAPLKRFRSLYDINMTPPNIDWVGNLRIPNYKKIK